MIHVEQHGAVRAIRMARMFLGRPLYWTAAYWVDGLLIDSGPACLAKELGHLLRQFQIDQIVVTHGHEDTIGGLPFLREQYPDIPIYAPLHTLPILEQPTQLHLHLYRRLIWGKPKAVANVQPLDEFGNRLQTAQYNFRVIETPGHSRDHVSLFEPEQRWLFCGDAFIGGKDKAWPSESEMFGTISSLRTLASLRPERLFPGSGLVRRTAQPELHEKIRYLIELCRDVARLESLDKTVRQSVIDLFKSEPPMHFLTLGHFSAANLVRACRDYNEVFSLVPYEWSDDKSPSMGKSYADSDDGSTDEPTGRSDFIR